MPQKTCQPRGTAAHQPDPNRGRMRARYTAGGEIAMLDAVMQRVPVHQAVARLMAEMKEKRDDIERFPSP